jgi:hypothetical protein
LNNALTSNPAHIVPDRMLRQGEQQKREALRLIQEALNKLQAKTVFLDLVPIPQGEIDGKVYGSQTEAAVLKFKRVLDIRRPGHSQVDPICGMSTLAHLDDEMKKVEDGSKPTPSAPPEVPVTMDVEIILSELLDNRNKSDLESTLGDLGRLTTAQRFAINMPLPILGVPAVPFTLMPLFSHPEVSLKTYLSQEAVPASLATSAGQQILRGFFTNNIPKAIKIHFPGTDLSKTVAENKLFIEASIGFEGRLHDRIVRLANNQPSVGLSLLLPEIIAGLQQNPAGQLQPPFVNGTNSFPAFRLGEPLAILGQFQGTRVTLTRLSLRPSLKRRVRFEYDAVLLYDWFDHFGIDDGDLTKEPGTNHGSPGQVAMWILQRKHHPNNMPYVVRIVVNRTITREVDAV